MCSQCMKWGNHSYIQRYTYKPKALIIRHPFFTSVLTERSHFLNFWLKIFIWNNVFNFFSPNDPFCACKSHFSPKNSFFSLNISPMSIYFKNWGQQPASVLCGRAHPSSPPVCVCVWGGGCVGCVCVRGKALVQKLKSVRYKLFPKF